MLCSRFSTRAVCASNKQLSSCFAAATTSSLWMPRRFTASEGAEAKKETTEGAEKKKEDSSIPAEIHEEMNKLKAELKKKTEEVEEFKRKALYSAAEAENARRIAREDVKKANDFGITKFAKDVLEVNDTLERAIEAFEKLEPEEKKTLTEHKILNSLVTGVKMSHSVMVHNMSRHGVEPIKANPGDTFDEKIHDAVFQSPASEECPPGTISNVVKKGFMLKERVLRATQCGVAADIMGQGNN